MRFRTFTESCLILLFVSGICFSDDSAFISMSGDCRYPSVATEGNNMYLAWLCAEGKLTNLYFKRSIDEGKTWNSARKLCNENADCLPPSIAVNSGIVHLAWIDYGETVDGELYYARSRDGGETWEKNVLLVKDANSARYPSVICQGNNVYLIWQDVENKVFFKASYDQGRTWEQETMLGKVGKHSCYCFPPALSINGNNLAVVWTDFSEDNKGFNIKLFGLSVFNANDSKASLFNSNKKMVSSVVCRTSTNNGRIWSNERVLARCKVSKEMKDEIDNPIMLSDGSLSYLFWLDRRNVQLGEIFYTRFDPFAKPGTLSGRILYPSPKRSPKRPSVVFDKEGNLHIAWATFFGGESIIHYGEIDPAGNVLKEKKDISSTAGRYFNPTMARTSSGLLHIFWFNELRNKDKWSVIFLKTSKDNGATWENWGSQIKDIQN
jgi:hypothetical protein